MRELHIGNGSIIVSFDVCNAVFNYSVALANAGVTDRVTVPILEDGVPGFSNILLGPSTQLFCTSGNDDETVFDDADVVADLERRLSELTPGSVSPSNHASDQTENDWGDRA